MESVVFRPGFDDGPGPLALIVEDELLIAMALELLLTSHGWRVLGPALSIEDALWLLRTERPDVAVLDLNVKDRFVTPVAEVLLAWGVPFLVASGQGLREPGIGLLANVPWVDKPINEERLAHCVEAALAEINAPGRAEILLVMDLRESFSQFSALSSGPDFLNQLTKKESPADRHRIVWRPRQYTQS